MSTNAPRLATDDPVLFAFAEEVGSDGAIAVAGGRTRWSQGGALAEGTRVVEAPRGVVEYKPAEMTVCVRAGTPVAELEAALGEAGQRSALPNRGGTVGGAIAVGENHVDRLGRGAIRDSVLQVRYVSAEGRLVASGGPVVKNVSGFNLPRLLTGSLGTFGLFAELILRTNPRPEVSRWLRGQGVDPAATFDGLLRAAAVLWDGESTWVHLEGHGVDVDEQSRALDRIGQFEPVEEPPPLPPESWSMSPAQAARVDREKTGDFVASIGVGRVWAQKPQPLAAPDPVVRGLCERAKAIFDPTGRLNPGRQP
ncbi:MAG: FAD-binding protein [Myxococcota bacterium]|jgi:glycolate oxidase FAD binding subunit|nr:FAD-binding protein [Myxococcota bacterium]